MYFFFFFINTQWLGSELDIITIGIHTTQFSGIYFVISMFKIAAVSSLTVILSSQEL